MDNPNLSSLARAGILDSQNQPYLSVASIWEIAIKVQLKKLLLQVGGLTYVDEVVQTSSSFDSSGAQ